MTVENRNSVANCEKSVWELISAKWNDPLFAPETEELPELHSDFICSETVDYEMVSGMVSATPEKCQGKFAGMVVELSRVIGNWERSGQGDGGVERDKDGDDDLVQLGSLRNRERGALDCRASFVPYSSSYLLYLWHMLDKHNLLGSSLQRLGNGVSCADGGSGVPSVINRHKDTGNDATDDEANDSTGISSNKDDDIGCLLRELGEKTVSVTTFFYIFFYFLLSKLAENPCHYLTTA
jgi:hypothetical protein